MQVNVPRNLDICSIIIRAAQREDASECRWPTMKACCGSEDSQDCQSQFEHRRPLAKMAGVGITLGFGVNRSAGTIFWTVDGVWLHSDVFDHRVDTRVVFAITSQDYSHQSDIGSSFTHQLKRHNKQNATSIKS
ncbi:hypothetical protein PsYK624_123120 [Phanerochaete sordida]|uniref:Uncharacterized protein n=1 Tax=Phanerochaete sordida TaxID=48140 RepID=A0A9P3GKU8_9APHY|nr:hypothetical protein PsYK624_123120 [Phanerochaete sordida]